MVSGMVRKKIHAASSEGMNHAEYGKIAETMVVPLVIQGISCSVRHILFFPNAPQHTPMGTFYSRLVMR